MNKNIVLIGFMGTSKTSTGKYLAGILNREFVDTDELIVSREGRAVSEIFAEAGEQGFRKIEHEIILELSGEDNRVIACGGGVVLNDENMLALRRNGVIVCLTARAETVEARLSGDTGRPLLSGGAKREDIINLMEQRRGKYEKYAQYVIPTDELTVAETAEKILEVLEGRE